MHSGINLFMNPRRPRLAASIAAYSRRRVLSDVQYCIVAGGWGWGRGMVLEFGEVSGVGREGKWKNWFAVCGGVEGRYGIVCLAFSCGRWQ